MNNNHELVSVPSGDESAVSSQEFANVGVQVAVLGRTDRLIVSASREEEVDVQKSVHYSGQLRVFVHYHLW